MKKKISSGNNVYATFTDIRMSAYLNNFNTNNKMLHVGLLASVTHTSMKRKTESAATHVSALFGQRATPHPSRANSLYFFSLFEP